jgi:hypothetical protein
MCDCYDHRCKVRRCDSLIPVHIGNFDFPRTEVEAWCHRHIPANEPGITVFKLVKKVDEGSRGHQFPKGTKFALRLCKGELNPVDNGVEINLSEAVEQNR